MCDMYGMCVECVYLVVPVQHHLVAVAGLFLGTIIHTIATVLVNLHVPRETGDEILFIDR